MQIEDHQVTFQGWSDAGPRPHTVNVSCHQSGPLQPAMPMMAQVREKIKEAWKAEVTKLNDPLLCTWSVDLSEALLAKSFVEKGIGLLSAKKIKKRSNVVCHSKCNPKCPGAHSGRVSSTATDPDAALLSPAFSPPFCCGTPEGARRHKCPSAAGCSEHQPSTNQFPSPQAMAITN